MSARGKIISDAMKGDPVKYTGSLYCKKASPRMEEWGEDDPLVCLNCDMPPERCHGTDDCYLKQKEKRENENRN